MMLLSCLPSSLFFLVIHFFYCEKYPIHLSITRNYFLVIPSINSEASASEFLERIEEIFSLYYMHSDVSKSLTKNEIKNKNENTTCIVMSLNL